VLESIYLLDIIRDIQSLVKRSGFLQQFRNMFLNCILPKYILLQAPGFHVLFFFFDLEII